MPDEESLKLSSRGISAMYVEGVYADFFPVLKLDDAAVSLCKDGKAHFTLEQNKE